MRLLFLLFILFSSVPACCQDVIESRAPESKKGQVLTLFVDPNGVVRIQKYTGSDYTSKSAPVDRGMKQVDSIILNRQVNQEEDSFLSPDHSSSNAHFHKVKIGETLQDIARKCHTTVEQLCKLNHISKNVKLKPGQILKYN